MRLCKGNFGELLIGLIGDWLGAAATVLVLGLLSLIAAYRLKLPEVSEPS